MEILSISLHGTVPMKVGVVLFTRGRKENFNIEIWAA
jgi:hypothetical protein